MIYRNRDYTKGELAKKLGVNQITFKRYCRKYGEQEAIRIAEMNADEYAEWLRDAHKRSAINNGRTMWVDLDGEQISLTKAAKKLQVGSGSLSKWIKELGMKGAIKKARMPPSYRRKNGKCRVDIDSDVGKPERPSPDIPANDPDYELKNRIISWRQQGWSDDEIKIKSRSI